MTVTLADQARAAAAADKAVAAGERLGPLAGVPFTIKEGELGTSTICPLVSGPSFLGVPNLPAKPATK